MAGIIKNEYCKSRTQSTGVLAYIGESIGYFGSIGQIYGAQKGWIKGLPKYENVGDILKIILDLDKEILIFVINGESHQVQTDDIFRIDKNIKYRLAVSLCPGRKLQLW